MEKTAVDNRSWTLSFALLGLAFLAVFGIFLFTQLSQRPMHNDEAVNAWFFEKLLTAHTYQYDPNNYHGPSLYYLQLPVTWLSPHGITPISIRAGVATTGLLLLAALLLAKRRIGRWGALAAMILLGSSCAFLFYSRYFIHEIYFVFFTYGIYLSGVYWSDTRRPVYFYLLCVFAALLYTTKETSVLVLGVLSLSAILSDLENCKTNAWESVHQLKFHLLGGLGVALLIWLLLYSSFFTNLHGLLDSIATYRTWMGTGLHSRHEKPFLYFIRTLLLPYELPFVFLGLVGAVAAVLTGKKSGLFLLLWTIGILLVHSAIPYKTPWLVLNILLPMALLGGFGLQTIIDHIKTRQNIPMTLPLMVFVLIGTVICLIRQFPKTIWIAYVEYDNESFPYVYVHTSRDVYRLRNDIDRIAKKSSFGTEIPIAVVSAVEWPLPFYLRQYQNAMFIQSVENMPNLKTPVIIAQKDQHEALAKRLDESKYTVSPYLLRVGVPLEMWVSKEYALE